MSLEESVERYAAMMAPGIPGTFKKHPVVITPSDAIVQQAVNEMGPMFANMGVDVIKLEPACPGNRLAWVTNKDLIEGMPGKQRVIHLCLKKIMDSFKKTMGAKALAYNPASATHNQELKEIVKRFLQKVVIPHESVHIQQEVGHGGEFGPSPELQAERAEDWREFEQMGITHRAAVCAAMQRMADERY